MSTKRITVTGLVQGIGYRPYVAELAEKFHISGWVKNTGGIVTICADGSDGEVSVFCHILKYSAPAGARVKDVTEEEAEPDFLADSLAKAGKKMTDDRRFFILPSDRKEQRGYPRIPADLPTCPICEAELKKPENRRYHHPFISCTSCGPRYSIIEALPYDRERITMKKFDMCPACHAEYITPGNRRRHAQTIACHDCGPKLSFNGKEAADAIEQAAELLKAGGIVAVKDIGGFHLACSPFDGAAVDRLRRLKGRESKPFAVMFSDISEARDYCHINSKEESLLASAPRPIVLLKHRKHLLHEKCDLQFQVCGSSPDIGALLPCNPVQILLTEACGPLIMTSANRSGELILTEGEAIAELFAAYLESLPEKEREQEEKLLGILDHDRPILTSLDDSIQRVLVLQNPAEKFRVQTFRRARGMTPTPLDIPGKEHMLALGGDLKATFAFSGEGRAYPSQYLGDLEDESCFLQYQNQIHRMQSIFGFAPKKVLCDLHPAYRSSKLAPKLAKELGGLAVTAIQHHKAHAASVLAEHDVKGKAICFAFDGTGYGEDGTIWGGEAFAWDGQKMGRFEHLPTVTLIGGDQGAKNAKTILYGYLNEYQITDTDAFLTAEEQKAYSIVQKAISAGVNTVGSSSMGRLFDAVSALLGVCDYNSYEGQAPIELENLAATAKEAFALTPDPKCWIPELVQALATAATRSNEDLRASLALGFIHAVADWTVLLCRSKREEDPEYKSVVLSGGSFQNRILTTRVIDALEADGFSVYANEQVPAGDGGICLGQLYLAERGY